MCIVAEPAADDVFLAREAAIVATTEQASFSVCSLTRHVVRLTRSEDGGDERLYASAWSGWWFDLLSER